MNFELNGGYHASNFGLFAISEFIMINDLIQLARRKLGFKWIRCFEQDLKIKLTAF